MSEDTYQLDGIDEHADRFILLSGCSGGGKSTLLAALGGSDCHTFAEPGRQIVKEQMLIGGPALPWSDPALFAEFCVSRAIHMMVLARSAEGICLFDRGIPDAIAFFDYLGLSVPAHLDQAARKLRYNLTILVTPPWPELFRGDAERQHGLDEAVSQYEASLRTFDRLGYATLEVPRTGVTERAAFVRRHMAGIAAIDACDLQSRP